MQLFPFRRRAKNFLNLERHVMDFIQFNQLEIWNHSKFNAALMKQKWSLWSRKVMKTRDGFISPDIH